MKKLYTVKEVGQRLRFSEREIRRRIAAGEITCIRIGKRALRIEASTLAAIVSKARQAVA